ncbi:MAG: chorismate-binding protein, partial [Candidatus Eremiobacteraeota bacterium]|nr:chorismate-binding protein [Candidatus Eremiobacteraeota bacterium]
FSFSGDVNTCITIRTMLKRGNDLYLQAGAGIVADSEPAKEYEETLAKLAGLRSAVEMAEGGWLHGGEQ